MKSMPLLCLLVFSLSAVADETTRTVKPIPDVDKPIKLVVEGDTWQLGLKDDRYKYTCGTAGLANKLWGAGYREKPSKWDKNGGRITEFSTANDPQELYQGLLDWLGTYPDDFANEELRGKYRPTGLAGEAKYGASYLKFLKEKDPGKIRSYQIFTPVNYRVGKKHELMTQEHLNDAVRLFEQCQFLEIGAIFGGGGHAVSVKELNVTRNETGAITGVDAVIHDPDSDVVVTDPWPPQFKGDGEPYQMVVEDGIWKLRNDQDEAFDVKYYKVFCPPSAKVDLSAGSTNNPTITYDPATSRLQFSEGRINILDDLGGMSGLIDAAYQDDPILNASMTISDLAYQPFEPESWLDYDALPGENDFSGHVFTGGTISVEKDGDVLIEARIPFFRVIDGFNDTIADNFGWVTDIQINNSIGSAFLSDFAAQVDGPDTIMDFYAEIPGYDNFSQAFGHFSGTEIITHEGTYMLARNGTIPEPSGATLLGVGIAVVLLVRRRRK